LALSLAGSQAREVKRLTEDVFDRVQRHRTSPEASQVIEMIDHDFFGAPLNDRVAVTWRINLD